MKTVICCINSKYIHSSLAPWYLAAGVKQYATMPQDVTVLEATINQPLTDVINCLEAIQADVYAFCTYIWNIRYLKKMLPLLAAVCPKATFILGGPEVSFCPETILKDLPQVSYVLSGEGEESFPKLLDALFSQKTPHHVAGVSYRCDSAICVIPPMLLTQDPPDPYTAAYFSALNGRIAYMEASRGCPFSCAFCLSGRQDRLRLFPLERVKKDILLLANSGAKTVKFVDRTFNCHATRCREIITFILTEYGKHIPRDICFHFEVAADLFDAQTLSLLSTAPAGLFQLEAGLQSFHAETLAAVTRKTDMQKLCENVKTLRSYGNMHIHIDLIAGLPRENLSIFRESFNCAFALQPHMLQLGFLKLLHGSALRQQIAENGYAYTPDAPYEVYKTAWMSTDDFECLHRLEDVTERVYNSGRFTRTVFYMLQTTGITPFDLFDGFADFLLKRQAETAQIPLDIFTDLLLQYGMSLPHISENILRDQLICDSLSSRQINRLPLCLFKKDPRVSAITRRLAQLRGSGLKRGVAILQNTDNRVAVVEYTNRDPVTGLYPLEILSIDDILSPM